MIYSSVGYCVCGAEIWIEYLRDGAAWRPRFHDTAGREVARCPLCGRELDEDALASR